MKLEVDGTQYWIKFRHERKDPNGEASRDKTACFIMSGEIEVASAVVICHPNVQFCRASGRKFALAKAISRLFPSDRKEMSYKEWEENKLKRQQFWTAIWLERIRILELAQEQHDKIKGDGGLVAFPEYSV